MCLFPRHVSLSPLWMRVRAERLRMTVPGRPRVLLSSPPMSSPFCSCSSARPSTAALWTRGNSELTWCAAYRRIRIRITAFQRFPALTHAHSPISHRITCTDQSKLAHFSSSYPVAPISKPQGRELAEALQATGAVLSGVRSSQPPGPQAVANAILAAAAARQGTRAGAVQVVADLGSKVRGTDGSGTLSLLQHAEHSDNVDSAWQQRCAGERAAVAAGSKRRSPGRHC